MIPGRVVSMLPDAPRCSQMLPGRVVIMDEAAANVAALASASESASSFEAALASAYLDAEGPPPTISTPPPLEQAHDSRRCARHQMTGT